MTDVTFDSLSQLPLNQSMLTYLKEHVVREGIVRIVFRPRPSPASYQTDDIWEFKNAQDYRVFSLLRHHPSLEFHVWRPC